MLSLHRLHVENPFNLLLYFALSIKLWQIFNHIKFWDEYMKYWQVSIWRVLGESKVVSEVNQHFIRKYQRKEPKLYPSFICITDASV